MSTDYIVRQSTVFFSDLLAIVAAIDASRTVTKSKYKPIIHLHMLAQAICPSTHMTAITVCDYSTLFAAWPMDVQLAARWLDRVHLTGLPCGQAIEPLQFRFRPMPVLKPHLPRYSQHLFLQSSGSFVNRKKKILSNLLYPISEINYNKAQISSRLAPLTVQQQARSDRLASILL